MPIDSKILDRLRVNDASLRELNLSRNKLTDADIEGLCDVLLKNKNTALSSLNLSWNLIGDVGVTALAKNTTITLLDVSQNIFSSAGAAAFAKNTSISSFNMGGNNIGLEGANAFARNTKITSLNLENCGIGDEEAAVIAKNTVIKKLNMRNNNIFDAGAKALAQNNTITWLNLDQNHIGNAGVKAFAWNATLTSLSIACPAHGKIGASGAKVLAKNTTLLSLDLAFQDIGDDGAAAFAENTSLVSLDLRDNNIGDIGAIAIAESKTLAILRLYGNKVGVSGAKALAKNTSFISLDLGDNEIGTEGAKAFSLNTTVASLDISSNEISGEAETEFTRNTTITSIKLSCSDFLKDGGRTYYEGRPGSEYLSSIQSSAIRAMLERNQALPHKLLSACESDKTSEAQELIYLGVKPYGNYFVDNNVESNTLLHVIVKRKNLVLLKLALERGAMGERYVKNKNQQTAIDFAIADDWGDGIALLNPLKPLSSSRGSWFLSFLASPSSPSRTPQGSPSSTTAVVNNNNNNNNNNNVSSKNNEVVSQSETESFQTNFKIWAATSNIESATFLNTFPDAEKKTLLTFSSQERIAFEQSIEQLKILQASSGYQIAQLEARLCQPQNPNAVLLSSILSDSNLAQYYRGLLKILDQTFLAAMVISSGRVDASGTISAKLFSAASAVAGALFLPAAPFLNFAAAVYKQADELRIGQEQRTLAKWVDISSDICPLCIAIAIAVTNAKKQILTLGKRIEEPGLLSKLKRLKKECKFQWEVIQSGEGLTLMQEFALLDAETLLLNMLTLNPTENASQDKKVIQIVQSLIPGYQYPLSQSSQSSPILPIPSASALPAQDLSAIFARMQELELKQEESREAVNLAKKQAIEIDQLKAELKAQQEKTKILEQQQNRGGVLDFPALQQDGPQIQLQANTLQHPDLHQSVSSAALIATIYQEHKQHSARLGHLEQTASYLQEEVKQVSVEQSNLYAGFEKQERETERQIATARTAANLKLAEYEASQHAKDNKIYDNKF